MSPFRQRPHNLIGQSKERYAQQFPLQHYDTQNSLLTFHVSSKDKGIGEKKSLGGKYLNVYMSSG